MQTNPISKRHLPATDSRLKPGDFRLGSLESRAAARSMAEHRKSADDATEPVIHVVVEAFGRKVTKPIITRSVGPNCIIEIEDWTGESG